jgi:glucose/arabinose dehydrogenase
MPTSSSARATPTAEAGCNPRQQHTNYALKLEGLLKRWHKIVLGLLAIGIAGAAFGAWYLSTRDAREPSFVAWHANCATCHGADLRGTALAASLIDAPLKHGDSVEEMMAVIAGDAVEAHKADWQGELSPQLTKALALYISEHRQKFPKTSASYTMTPPGDRSIRSQHHDFRLERVTELVSRPYSIAPMPDGRLLVAEKIRGLSIIDASGQQGSVVTGTPETWEPLLTVQGNWLNLGIVLDVELHPNYAENGWVYLSHTEHCFTGCGWVVPGTMARVIRGRIQRGQWVDEEEIWSVHKDHYTPVPDGVAAGRLAFDKEGHLFVIVGGKNTYDKLHDLNTPYGKVHRVNDDGTVPEDNPFWLPAEARPEGSTIHTVWSYGHRTGQGLDAHPITGAIWNTEMGPRGGDEINHIQRGKNYGWPLYTNGLDYSGEEVSIGRELGLDFALEDTVLPVVDFTPAPAISNFTFHQGNAFPNWGDDLLVGSLKAATLYRVRIKDAVLVEQEKLVTDFGRIRDVAMGADGLVYIAIEHNENGSIWRLVPINSLTAVRPERKKEAVRPECLRSNCIEG